MNKGHCFQCEAKNPPDQLFCGQCGSSLVLKDYISAQVNKGVSEATRNREALLIADSVDVFERAWKWAKLALEVLAVPAGLVLLLLGWLGYKEFDLNRLATNAQNQIESTANRTKKDINGAAELSKRAVTESSGKAVEANKQLEQKAVQMAQEVSRTGERTKFELRSEASNVKDEVTKSRAELQQIHQLQPEFNRMQGQLKTATEQLAAQQKTLESSENFAKQVFSTHVSAMYPTENFNTPGIIVVPVIGNPRIQAVVYMLLPHAPIEGTVQVQWQYSIEPPGSYLNYHNLLVFFWGQSPESLKGGNIFVSYFPDKSDRDLGKALSIKDGRVYVDDMPMMKFGQADPDFSGNRWMPVQRTMPKP